MKPSLPKPEAATETEQIEETTKRGSKTAPVTVRLSDVKAEPVQWLWPGRIALGKLTILSGDPGLGKSFLTCDLAARVSTGRKWPDDKSKAPCGSVVILNCEDDLADTVRPRLDRHGADVAKVVALSAVRDSERSGERAFDLSRDLSALESAIATAGDCRLVVIDPVTAYLGERTDSHKASDVRARLAPLSALAARHRVAVVIVSHLNKGSGAAIYRTMGSLSFVAAARAAWCVSKDRANPQRRLLLPMKNNLAATNGLAYSIVDGVVTWEPDPIATTADEALSQDEPRKRGPDADVRDEAMGYLLGALGNGPRLARDILDEAANGYGIAKRTLDRARKELKVEAYRPKVPGPWWWRLPEADKVTNPPAEKQRGNLGNVDRNTA